MKYICLAYINEKKWEALAERGLKAYWNERFADNGRTALRLQNDKVSITDGPFAETKELMGAGCAT